MRKLVRHSVTGIYYSAGMWVDDWRLADEFNHYQEARKYAKEHALKDVELHYIFGDEPSQLHDWAVPLG